MATSSSARLQRSEGRRVELKLSVLKAAAALEALARSVMILLSQYCRMRGSRCFRIMGRRVCWKMESTLPGVCSQFSRPLNWPPMLYHFAKTFPVYRILYEWSVARDSYVQYGLRGMGFRVLG